MIVRTYEIPTIQTYWTIDVELGGKFLKVDVVGGIPLLFAVVDPAQATTKRTIHVSLVGNVITDALTALQLVGTYQYLGAVFAVHEIATGPGVNAPTTDRTILPGHSEYISGSYEIAAGKKLEIMAGATLEIG